MTAPMDHRYDRQVLLPEIGRQGQERLAAARVLIVGVGGLGSPVALYLAGAGVGTLGLVDGDAVSESNLQRQVLYDSASTGRPKAEEARRRLLALNPGLHVEAYPTFLTPENADELVGGYDIVVDGCDNFATRYLLNDTCIRLGKVYVYGAIRAFDGQVSVFNYRGRYSYRDLFPDEAGLLALPAPPKGVIGVMPGLVGCVEAGEVLKLITGYGEVLSGKIWQIDQKTMESCTILL